MAPQPFIIYDHGEVRQIFLEYKHADIHNCGSRNLPQGQIIESLLSMWFTVSTILTVSFHFLNRDVCMCVCAHVRTHHYPSSTVYCVFGSGYIIVYSYMTARIPIRYACHNYTELEDPGPRARNSDWLSLWGCLLLWMLSLLYLWDGEKLWVLNCGCKASLFSLWLSSWET